MKKFEICFTEESKLATSIKHSLRWKTMEISLETKKLRSFSKC